MSKNAEKIFLYSRDYILKHGYSPSFREIADALDLSLSTIHRCIKELEEKNMLFSSESKHKFMLTCFDIVEKPHA